jgi:hypothetical protein
VVSNGERADGRAELGSVYSSHAQNPILFSNTLVQLEVRNLLVRER